jgi:hypothetical protein
MDDIQQADIKIKQNHTGVGCLVCIDLYSLMASFEAILFPSSLTS